MASIPVLITDFDAHGEISEPTERGDVGHRRAALEVHMVLDQGEKHTRAHLRKDGPSQRKAKISPRSPSKPGPGDTAPPGNIVPGGGTEPALCAHARSQGGAAGFPNQGTGLEQGQSVGEGDGGTVGRRGRARGIPHAETQHRPERSEWKAKIAKET